eukprot:TRINITY_DN5243_c0_g1_i1.p1 TRINITY_DN5243_c0_g1~~TRINITY_DN5243_c0_g1_i1.p1  ORF type:complete len:111 (+),score=17.98 TRINITY_DN5243_c0_g1_i1:44-376(+)
MKKVDEEREESVDHDHAGFVPPAPQSNQEIEKFVKWKAKRNGIQEQKMIDAKIRAEQSMAAMATESEKRDTSNSFKQPLLDDSNHHKDSDIDYELMNQTQKKGGCCCVVM